MQSPKNRCKNARLFLDAVRPEIKNFLLEVMRTKSDEINGLFIFKISVYINISKRDSGEHQGQLHISNIQ